MWHSFRFSVGTGICADGLLMENAHPGPRFKQKQQQKKYTFIYIDAPFRIPSEANMGGVYCVTYKQHTYKYFAITPYSFSTKETNNLPCLHMVLVSLLLFVVAVALVVFTFCHHCVFIHNPPIIYLTNLFSAFSTLFLFCVSYTAFVSWLTSIWYYDFCWFKFYLNFSFSRSMQNIHIFFPFIARRKRKREDGWKSRVKNEKSFHYIMCKVVINLQILLSRTCC